ncbi:unnamed protein product [Adineta steineri]|uniref:Uncharacterized protein n=1 Tax=Adineta steineri TaxID=433720 RepID=A0A815LFV3_9BILA|nr:unnamed protein product [Adineta steineri]CAF1499144.1 unnamed protein product [Adineta steineri]CAF4089927.1 unnamed protein product [Adineta steineri]CAF4106029.1 unnamed protein product [Adineta steineri]
MTSTSFHCGRNSLMIENTVCSQLELQRLAPSFSHDRSTMYRRSSLYSLTPTLTLSPVSPQLSTMYSNTRTISSILSDLTTQFLKTKTSNFSKRSRTSSMNLTNTNRMESAND